MINMMKYQLLLIFLISYNLIEIIECKRGMAMEALTIATEIQKNFSIKYIPEPITPENIVDELISQYEYGINEAEKLNHEISNFFHEIVHEYNDDNLLETLLWDMERIDEFYVPFDELLQPNIHANLTALENYFNVVLSDRNDGVKYALNQMQSSTKKIFNILNLHINSDKLCNDMIILRQQHVAHLLNVAINKTYKGYFLIISAYKFFIRKYEDNLVRKLEYAYREAEEQIHHYVDEARSAMLKASRDIRNCNNQYDIKNVTYTEIVGPSQGFIFDSSAVDINSDCKTYNIEYKEIEDIKCKDNDKSLCFEQTCAGDGGLLKNCYEIGGDVMKICPATDVTKRYSSVETYWAKLGNRTAAEHCPKKFIERSLDKTTSLFSEKTGQFCYCNCERKTWKQGDVRAVSLQWIQANYLENRVITSLKFQEKNGMISLAAQHGVLLSGGLIDQKSVQWIQTLDTKKLNVKYGFPEYQYIYSKEGHIINGPKLINEKDYLNIKKGLSINLDEIIVPPHCVIVGVKLNKLSDSKSNDGDELELAILSMEFDIDTGKLNTTRQHYITATKFMMEEFKHTNRQIIDLGKADNPISMQGKNNNISAAYSKIKFQVTDKVKDIGQSIVPFIDIQDTSPLLLTLPLSTISLHHRGTFGSGGFIGFKFQSYDIDGYFEKIIYDNTQP